MQKRKFKSCEFPWVDYARIQGGLPGEEELLSTPVFPLFYWVAAQPVHRGCTPEMTRVIVMAVVSVTLPPSAAAGPSSPPPSSLPFGWGWADLRFLTPSTILWPPRRGCRQSLIKSPILSLCKLDSYYQSWEAELNNCIILIREKSWYRGRVTCPGHGVSWERSGDQTGLGLGLKWFEAWRQLFGKQRTALLPLI